MADIYTSKKDENIIYDVIQKGLKVKSTNKWVVLRIALAKSLKMKTEPDESLDKFPTDGRKEYRLETISGKGKEAPQDWNLTYKALLSIYYNKDIFSDDSLYRKLLQRHIRRGLREIGDTIENKNIDFHQWLDIEFFSEVESVKKITIENENKLVSALSEIGIQAEIRNKVIGPRLTRYILHLPNINHFDKLKRGGLDKLANILGMQRQGITQMDADEPKSIYLDIPRNKNTWNTITGAELRNWISNDSPKNYKLPVCIGVDVIGKPYFFDLATTPHLFVAGTTGSGKSICLHSLIVSLLEGVNNFPSKQDIQFALIDPKLVELSTYESLPNLFGKKIFGDDKQDIVDTLNQLLDEMDSRNKLFRKLGVRDIDEIIEKGHQLPRIIVFIEELASLFDSSKKEIEPLIIQLAQKARSSGIHLVLATQRPDSQVFSGLLRSNIPSRVALSVQKATESKIILDYTGAEKLLGQGDMLIKLSSENTPKRLHGIFINRDDSLQAIKNYIKRVHNE